MQGRRHGDADQTDKESSSKPEHNEHGGSKSTATEKKRRKVIVEEVSEPSVALSEVKQENPERDGVSASTSNCRSQVQHIDLSQIPQEKVREDVRQCILHVCLCVCLCV